ncbi:hypothetical protein ILYODFUR_037477 [Ilyodon furcidens]|uniref:Uncharacterized protein n=1 Tax=Ilyodon furcidens TaxID=33524 RepID=A0ABV0VB02_9TELE
MFPQFPSSGLNSDQLSSSLTQRTKQTLKTEAFWVRRGSEVFMDLFIEVRIRLFISSWFTFQDVGSLIPAVRTADGGTCEQLRVNQSRTSNSLLLWLLSNKESGLPAQEEEPNPPVRDRDDDG